MNFLCLSIQAISHPYYNAQNFNNDITLLKLTSPVQMTSRVSPVCLASSSTNIPSGTKCVTTGWGKTGQTCEWTAFLFSLHNPTYTQLCRDLWLWIAFLFCPQQVLATCSRPPCLCSAMLSALSTGVTTGSLMPWSVLVPLECLPAR